MGGGEQAKYLIRMEVYDYIKAGESELVAAMGPKAVPALKNLIDMGNFWEQTKAVEALCRIDDPKSTRILKKLLEHPERTLRKAVIEIIGDRELGWLGERLRKMEKQDPDHAVRWSARRALDRRSSIPPAPRKKIPDNFGNLKSVGKRIVAR